MYSYWKCLGMNNSAMECRVTLGNESQLLNPNWICKDENSVVPDSSRVDHTVRRTEPIFCFLFFCFWYRSSQIP